MTDALAIRKQTLLPPAARTARRAERQRLVLRFLRAEIWSSTSVLGQVMGIRSPQGAHKALTGLEKDGYLSRMPVTIGGRRALTVWGITAHGQAFAFDLDAGETPVSAYFEPTRVSLLTMDHHLAIQQVRLQAEALNWSNWVPGTRLGPSVPHTKRPDAVVTNPDGVTVAIEIERTIKTTKRYEVIVSDYLQAVKRDEYGWVQYLCPTPEFAARLARIIQAIQTVSVQGQRVTLQAHHTAAFQFTDYASWPS